jgi:hypothetical protein
MSGRYAEREYSMARLQPEVQPMSDGVGVRWSPTLRRAIMRVRPDFFSRSREERERYGVRIPERDNLRLDRIFLKELFGIIVTTDNQALAAHDELTGTQNDLLNATVLPLTGIGEDNFFLNEFFAEGESVLSFGTVHDYDRAEHEIQESARAEKAPSYVKRPYHGVLHFAWARLFMDDVFTYGHLSMVAGLIHARADEHVSEIVDALVPQEYVRGDNHGKRSERGFQWDMRIEANGKEGLLDDLRFCQNAYFDNRYAALAKAWDRRAARTVYISEPDVPGEMDREFLFSDTAALKAVRFRSFLRDCRAIERPAAELTPHIDSEKQAASIFMHAEHERLLRDFDPNVARMRKRRKIVMREDAADKLF